MAISLLIVIIVAILKFFTIFVVDVSRLAIMAPPHLHIGFSNINSILGKFIDLKAEIITENFDYFSVAETKIDSSIDDDELFIPGYSLFRCDRKKGGGGVAAYVR